MTLSLHLTPQQEIGAEIDVDLQRVRQPQYGRYLDELDPGQVFEHPRGFTFDRGNMLDFARTYMQANPLYLNLQYAQAHDIPIPYTVQDPPAVDDEDELKTDTLAEMYAMRRRLYPGRQVSEPGPHSGLGLECYAQVTSPLRRYHDMLVHQQLRAYLRGESLLDAETVMTRTAEARTQARHVRTAERLSISHWLMVYLRRHPDWQGEAIALEQRRTRTLLLLPELALETEIYGRNGIYPDDKAEVALTGVDLPELTATFRFV